jgi:hypothetical protein
VAQNHIGVRPIRQKPDRQTIVKIDDVEPAAIGYPTAPGQLPCLTDGHRRDVERPHVQASVSQPDSAKPLAASQIESVTGGWECVRVRRKDVWRSQCTDGHRSAACVPPIPVEAILRGHPCKPRASPERPPDFFWTHVDMCDYTTEGRFKVRV